MSNSGHCNSTDTPTVIPSQSCCDPTNSKGNHKKSLWFMLRLRFYSAWMWVIIIPALVALLDWGSWSSIMLHSLNSFTSTLPYIVCAVLVIAYLKATGSEQLIAKAFEGKEMRMIFLAALMGGLAPFCSCEVIPFIAGLLALGAPLSAVMAFWLSSPLIDPPALLITAGALGWQFASAKAVAAVAMGLMGGFGVRLLSRFSSFQNPLKQSTISSCSGALGIGLGAKPKWLFWQEPERVQVFREQGWQNGLFLAKWLAVAYLLESLMVHYISAETVAALVGGEGVTPVVISALVGMPAYLNSYVAPPLVAGLVEQGMTVASAMSFMLAGAISSVPAMTAVWSLVRPQVFAAYLGFGIIGAVFLGLGYGQLASLS